MRFSHQLRYDAAPAQVYAMLGDPRFRERVCERIHAVRYDVSISGSECAMEVTVAQSRPTEGAPAVARKFIGEEVRIVQDERWSSPQHAALELVVPGRPGHMKGTIELAADGAGTVETVTGEIHVPLPLVGGRLEALIAQLFVAALDAEQSVGRAWLAGDR